MGEDDTQFVCVCESPGVPGNQARPWPAAIDPHILLWAVCSQPGHRLLIFSPCFYLRFCPLSPLFPHLSLEHPRAEGRMFWEKNLALLTNRSCFANSGASWQISGIKKKSTSAVLCVVELLVNTFGRHPLQVSPTSTLVLAHLKWEAAWECLLMCTLTQSLWKTTYAAMNIPQ